MTVLVVPSFGGEVPRVSPRALPAGAAQLHQNLLATANEFRPLLGDKDVAAAVAGARTLYRLSRNADGALLNDDTSGWLTSAEEKNYVKGQLNDDATERTAVTWADGTQPPRVIDAKGADRPLGVPAPVSIGVTANVTDEFTLDEALTWVADELVPALATALQTSLYEHPIGSRFNGNVPIAGTTTAQGMVHYTATPWYAAYVMPRATADARNLTGGDLGRVNIGASDAGFLIETGPFWGRVTDLAGLKTKLAAIVSPKGGAQAFTSAQIDLLAPKLAALFDPAGASLKADRAEMDKLAAAFVKALSDAAARPVGSGRPVEPTKPSGPEQDLVFVGGDPPYEYQRTPEWVAYDEAMRNYRDALAAWESAGGAAQEVRIADTAEIARLRKAAENLSNEIEAEYYRRKAGIKELVAALVDGENLLGGEDSIIEVDPDRIVESRFYIATYVTDWGEESAPSPVSDMIEIDQNDSATVTVPAPPAGRFIERWRLYRSNAGSAAATFQFVEELLIATRTYTDALKPEQLGEPCPTLTWAEPPVRIDSGSAATIKPPKGPDPYLRGAVAMPNGIIAGFIDNFVAFCHPYHVYAWPVEYQITTEHPIVGLGVFGQTLFVGTRGNPYLISGSDSASMSAVKLPQQQACVSARSIVGVGGGVVYASPDGLCMATAGGVELLTGELFSREDWQALQPVGIVAAEHEGVYYFQTAQGCYALDFTARKLGRVDAAPTAFHRDTVTDGLFAVQGGRVLRLFSQGRRTARWKSGRAVLPAQSALAWVHVEGDQDQGAPVTVRWFGDGTLRHTAVFTDGEPQRLPIGRWLEHEIEVEGAARVTKLTLASATAELKGV